MVDKEINNYLRSMTLEQKKEYQRIKKIIKDVFPNATEQISYGIPTFRNEGRAVLHFGVFKDHLSLFPGSGAIELLKNRLSNYKLSKGTIKYKVDKPIPEALVRDILKINLEE